MRRSAMTESHSKTIMSIMFVGLLLLAPTVFAQGEDVASVPVGPYLGQPSPGVTPTQFAPDHLPSDGVTHCSPTFSPDGCEVFWSVILRKQRRGQIMCMRADTAGWTKPTIAPFSGIYSDVNPSYSPDGSRLYFASNRLEGQGSTDIWYVNRTDQGWSEPVNLGIPPNSEGREIQPSVAADGSLVFVGAMSSVEWNRGIYLCRKVDAEFAERIALPSSINSPGADAYPFIAPDHSYLLFCSSRPGCKSVETDLYISFRTENGEWGIPVQAGPEINNGKTVSFPRVTPDGKYLFFRRFVDGTGAFFWVEARILEELKPS
jgi:Tol biopolymer transport system component